MNSHKLLRMGPKMSIVHEEVSRHGIMRNWIVHAVDTRRYVIGRFSAPETPPYDAGGGPVEANITPAQLHSLTFADSDIDAFR